MVRCPGQDQRFWKPNDIFEIKCPNCETSIEFWKDEPKLKCPKCREWVLNPKLDLSCAKWCKFAKECLGVSVSQDSNLYNSILGDAREIFVDNPQQISHILNKLKYADQIQLVEGGDPLVVKASVILYDVGIYKAKSESQSAVGQLQEIEGIIAVREILAKHGVESEIVENICRIIISYHNSNSIDTIEFRIFRDVELLEDIDKQFRDSDGQKVKEFIDCTFKTNKGRELAKEFLEPV